MQILLFPMLSMSQGITRATFGEICNKETRCNSQKYLTCSDGHCRCLMPDSMVFEETSAKCRTLAGERCQFTTVEGDRTWYDEFPCITNAICDGGVCNCEENYFEVSNGTCQHKLEYGAACINSHMCRSDLHLVCGAEKECLCDKNRLSVGGTCRIKTGSNCFQTEECVPGATCSITSSLSFHTCNCDDSYFSTANGACVPRKNIGSSCESAIECHNTIQTSFGHSVSMQIDCTNGKCECDPNISKEIPAPDFFLVQNTEYICAKHLNQVCDYDEECITGSRCISGKCECDNNHYPGSNNSFCEFKKRSGETCENNNQCMDIFKCDRLKSVCTCPDGKAFNYISGQCVLALGSDCKIYREVTENVCVPNATCNRNYGGVYQCRCDVGYTKDSRDGYCYVEVIDPSNLDTCFKLFKIGFHFKENGACKGDTNGATRTCLPAMDCLNGRCSCPYPEHQKYDSNESVCGSLVEGPCNSTENCIDNAYCNQELGFGQCHCMPGYINVNRQCEIRVGQKCQQNLEGPHCDSHAPSKCSVRNVCECSEFKIYDNETETCVGLVGARCIAKEPPAYVVNRNESCVEGAFCSTIRGSNSYHGLCKCEVGWKVNADRTCSTAEKISQHVQAKLLSGENVPAASNLAGFTAHVEPNNSGLKTEE